MNNRIRRVCTCTICDQVFVYLCPAYLGVYDNYFDRPAEWNPPHCPSCYRYWGMFISIPTDDETCLKCPSRVKCMTLNLA